MNKWIELVKLLAPTALAAIPQAQKLAPFVPIILHGIETAESFKGASGAEKKAHVLDLVQTGVIAANATGKVALDLTEVSAAAGQGIDLAVAIANLTRKTHPRD